MSTGRTHRPELEREKCELCGGCTWKCPAAVFPELKDEQGSLRGTLFTKYPYPGETAELPPCRLACPLGQNVPAYISAIAREDMAGAAATIRETNALPSVCGRACIASCMRACTRAGIDEGLDVRGLKRFAVEAVKEAPAPEGKQSDGPFVAVVGSGPAGLAAAHRLAQLKLRPVVFEAKDHAGGMAANVIPSFVMPKEMLQSDIANLEKSGVEIRTGIRIGRDTTWNEIGKEFDAVLIATGAGRKVMPAIDGKDLDGSTHAIDFCQSAIDGDAKKLKGAAVIQGGSKSSLQAARVALRLGAEPVHVVHTAPLELWPAGADAIKAAEEEGVALLPGHRVKAVQGKGKVDLVVVRPVRATEPDGVGRPRSGGEGKEVKLDAILFVAAPDRMPNREDQPDLNSDSLGVLGNLKVDKDYQLSRAGWFAAGEAATGAATVVDSMATGRLAANAIGRYIAKKTEAK